MKKPERGVPMTVLAELITMSVISNKHLALPKKWETKLELDVLRAILEEPIAVLAILNAPLRVITHVLTSPKKWATRLEKERLMAILVKLLKALGT